MYSAKRFLSYADPKNSEAQAFNYGGKLSLFSSIKIPMLAVFGSKETKTDKAPTQMLKVLEEKSRSELLVTKEIKGADHPFVGYEDETAKAVLDFLKLV
jgi:alpha/beta superfamily hydrolase